MEYTIKPYHALPCALEEFTINNKNADADDFGRIIMNDGDCMECQCGCRFEVKLPDDAVLEKYNLTASEYREIAYELKSKLYVSNCGWCS